MLDSIKDKKEYVLVHKVYKKSGTLCKVGLVTDVKSYSNISNYLFRLSALCRNYNVLLRGRSYKRVKVLSSKLFCSYLEVELDDYFELFKIVKI